MPEYLSPGVYVEEISTGPVPIEGVSTSTTAFLGETERGPEYPKLVTSWLQFQRWYGGYLPLDRSYLPYAVQGFFDNGGQRLYVARILGAGAAFAQQQVGNLLISALGKGAWGNRIFIRISEATKRDPVKNPDWFKLTLLYYAVPPPMNPFVDPLDLANATNPDRREPDIVEQFDNLVHTAGAQNNVETVVNAGSRLVRVWFTPAGPAPVPVQANAPFGPLSANGADGAAVVEGDYTGDLAPIDPTSPKTIELLGRTRGLKGIEAIDEISLIAVPDEVRSAPPGGISNITTQVINQCENLKDRFALVSVEPGHANESDLQPPRDTLYGAFYYPWIQVYDPVSRGPVKVPATGHIAGIYARTDVARGVHKAPANEVVRDATDLEFPVTKGMQDILNPRNVNCIRDFRPDGRGIRVWGARTMSSDPQWKYVNVRRLFIFVEESIDQGTQWVVFEPNDYTTWARVVRSISNFLRSIWRDGALMGLTEAEAFFVKCDRTTMTQDDIDNGRLICYIGIAPVKPAEFVIFRISQKTLEANAT